jgi:hypothetical protein
MVGPYPCLQIVDYVTESDKHYSLLWFVPDYGRKKFYRRGPGANMRNFFLRHRQT